jgi:tRNA:m4X modification enzyme
VADVRHLASAVLPVVPSGPRTVAVTKHLCGGATDSSLRTLVAGELGERIGGVVLAPCCHQKCRFAEYCARRWLQESGFCTTHRGVRGGEECNDWKT